MSKSSKRYKHLLVFDPGGTTGVAYVDISQKLPLSFMTWSVADSPSVIEELLDIFRMVLSDGNSDILVLIERFRLRPGDAHHQVGSIFPSVLVTGRVEVIAHLADLPINYKEPVDMVPFKDVRVLQRVLEGELPKSEHERDALRHVLSFYFSNGYHKKED